MANERQSSALPPAQPSYILRGHTSQLHSVQFVRQNSRLLTGDADGWVVYWKVETKRALAVWKAHNGAILGTAEWGRNNIVTHGRDNSLRIWQLRASDESTFSTILPAEDATTSRPKPWLLHTLPVNTLNFCAFSICYEHAPETTKRQDDSGSAKSSASVLVATPATDDKKINVYQLPEEKLRFIVPRVPTTDTGMVMAVKLVYHALSKSVLVLAGYEGGITAVHQLSHGHISIVKTAHLVYLSQPHTQPILSLDVSPDAEMYFTSSADAAIAAHRIPTLSPAREQSGSSGMQSGDSTVAGNESTIAADPILKPGSLSREPDVVEPRPAQAEIPPTYPFGTMPLPRLESEDEYPISVSDPQPSSISFEKQPIPTPAAATSRATGLSSLLSSAAKQPRKKVVPLPPTPVTIQSPDKTLNTKHAGQQSLRVRSDGRILVTGGWDSRIRLYSTKTLKEVAVLKWHKEGVYVVDFAEILEAGDLRQEKGGDEVVMRETGLGKLQRQREEQIQLKHWVVAGAKDGKVSLWEVF